MNNQIMLLYSRTNRGVPVKSFKEYISENTEATNIFKNAKGIAFYIKGEKRKQSYIDALTALEIAAEEKEIYNARFDEYKSSINLGIEYAYNTMFAEIQKDVRDAGQETSDLWSMTSAGDVKKITKIFNSMTPKNNKAISFTNAISDIHGGFKIIKSYVKAGKPPAQPKPDQFYKPIASVDATKLALKFMKEASDSFSKELRTNIESQMMTAYNKIKNLTDPKELPSSPTIQQVASTIFLLRKKDGKPLLELISGHKERVEKLINDSVNSIVDGFVSKSSSKLSLILQKKDAPKSHKIVRTNVNNGMVENVMQFEFNDGSSFTMESSVVFKRSSGGKLFFQYPTRFRNIKMADGSMMKSPSEEKMIKEF
jgi:hypothetical protein